MLIDKIYVRNSEGTIRVSKKMGPINKGILLILLFKTGCLMSLFLILLTKMQNLEDFRRFI